jgi:hypothetical protein
VRRVGYLQATISGLPSEFYEVLRDGLRKLGYVRAGTSSSSGSS